MSAGTTSEEETPLTCEVVAVQKVTERYIAGHLSEVEQAAFEQHYFTCPRCVDELKTYRALQAELQRDRQAHATPRRHIASGKWMAIAAGLLLATTAGIWMTAPGREAPPPSGLQMPASPTASPDSRPISVPPAPLPAPSDPLTELGSVQAPRFQPPRLRGSGAVDAQFEKGMAHYIGGRYREAIPDLASASARAPAMPERAFYLGASYLMVGDIDLAVDRLNVVVAAGESAYLEDARFLTAKALVRKGDLTGAQRQLHEVIRLSGDREQEARGLRDKLRALGTSTPP